MHFGVLQPQLTPVSPPPDACATSSSLSACLFSVFFHLSLFVIVLTFLSSVIFYIYDRDKQMSTLIDRHEPSRKLYIPKRESANADIIFDCCVFHVSSGVIVFWSWHKLSSGFLGVTNISLMTASLKSRINCSAGIPFLCFSMIS